MVLSGHIAFLNTLTLRWPRSGPRSVLPDRASLLQHTLRGSLRSHLRGRVVGRVV